MSWPPAPADPLAPTGRPAPRVRPSRWWYLAVAVLWLATIGLIASVGVTGARVVDHGVRRVPSNGLVVVPSDGLTLYASSKLAGHRCTATSTSLGAVVLDDIGFDLNATVNGRQVYALATTPDSMAPGRYRLACTGVTPGATLWTGDRIPFVSMAIRAIVAAVCLLAGLAFLIVLLIRRSIGKRRVREWQAAGAGYPGWPQQQPWPGGAAPYGTPGQPPYPPQYPPPPERQPNPPTWPPSSGQPPERPPEDRPYGDQPPRT